jgi:phosphatidylethanolamine-binding protein (PEBP) family uncharacterized protein
MSTDQAIGDWSDADWAQWWAEEVEPSKEWHTLESEYDTKGSFLGDRPGYSDDLINATGILIYSSSQNLPLDRLTAPSKEAAFSRMSYETKKRFFEGWYLMKERRRSGGDSAADISARTPLGDTPPADYWVNITLPNGNVVTIPTGDAPKPPETPDVVTEPIAAAPKKPRTALIATAAVVVLLIMFLLLITQLTGSDESAAPTTAAAASDTATSVAAAATPTTATAAVVAAPSTTLGGCAAAAEAAQGSDMTFSSPEFGDGTIPESWAAFYSEENGFPTPSFEIGGVPEGTTELAIVIQNVAESARDEVASATDLWTTSVPPGNPHWILTGISPDTTLVPATVGGVGLADGMVAQDHNTYGAGTPGNLEYNKFLGPHPGEVFLFTLFAMCEPEGDWYNPSNPAWMRGWAIDRTWFTAEAGF